MAVSRAALNTVLSVVLLLGALAWLWAFLGSPNFYQTTQHGPRWMVERASDHTVEGLVFILLPVGGITQAVTAALLLRGQAAPWAFKVAVVFCSLDLLALFAFLVLAVVLRNLNLH